VYDMMVVFVCLVSVALLTTAGVGHLSFPPLYMQIAVRIALFRCYG
jgi:hypothetical protein